MNQTVLWEMAGIEPGISVNQNLGAMVGPTMAARKPQMAGAKMGWKSRGPGICTNSLTIGGAGQGFLTAMTTVWY